MAEEFAGKVVMVTGANGNIGQAVARRFAGGGARLVLVGRKESDLRGLTNELGGMIGLADVTDPESVDALVRQVDAQLHRIDVLAHTVGGFEAGAPVHETGLDVWDRMMNLNARSVFVTCGWVARYMIEREIPGRITAILSKHAYKGSAKSGAYAAAKAAAQRVLESMAAELKDSGITVNGVVPSTIDTPQNRAAMPKADTRKWVQPEEIAEAIFFLSLDQSRSITGASLDIFGRV